MRFLLSFLFIVIIMLHTSLKTEAFSSNRIDGKDRFEVAVNISKEKWPNGGGNTVILANYNAFADALSASPLAYKHMAPILLSHPNKLTAVTKEEIIRLGANQVIIVGGTASISTNIENELKSMQITVHRIGGKDRFEVSASIAEKLPKPQKAIIAYGLNFPDALAIAPYASRNGYPILLTNTKRLSEPTNQYLMSSSIKSTIVVGGEASVSKEVFSRLPSPIRIGGKDRFEVAANIIKTLKLSTEKAYMATGLSFADALTGSIPAAMDNAPILLTRQEVLPPSTKSIIEEKNITNFTILGGAASVGEVIINQLAKNDSSNSPVVYLVPHADDEVLSYAVDVRNMIKEGRQVYLVLLSQGEDSGARNVQNGVYDIENINAVLFGKKVYCPWHVKFHNPITENYLHGHISREEFGKARVGDFFRATEALGVPKDHIVDEALLLSEYNSTNIQLIIEKYINRFPEADFRTMSKYDGHNHHALIGKTLETMEKQGLIGSQKTLYFISNFTDRFSNIKIPYKTYKVYLKNELDRKYILNGIQSYKDFYPQKGIYANGYHSVPSQFNSLERDMYTIFHY
jgi:N-acetylmuramoyl-L-alanine amidase